MMTAAVAVVVGGCTSDPAPIAQAAKDAVRTIDPADATMLAFGDSLEIVADLPATFDGDRVLYTSFASEDEVLGMARPDETEVVQGRTTTQSRPVLYDLGTKTFTVLDDGDRPEPTWVTDVSGNADTVVWTEGSGTMIDHSRFTVYAHDRATKQVTVIAELDDPDGQVVYGNDLDIFGGTAYFSTPAYPAKRGQEAVYAVPVDGSSEPRVVATGGEEIRIRDGVLTYLERDPRDDRAYPARHAYDLRTRATTEVPVSEHADEDGFCGATVTKRWTAWCVKRSDAADPKPTPRLTIRETSGRTTEFGTFTAASRGGFQPFDPMELGRWTAIGARTSNGQQREYLVDLDTEEVLTFPANTSFGWTSPDASLVLVSSYARGGEPAMQRVVRIPE